MRLNHMRLDWTSKKTENLEKRFNLCEMLISYLHFVGAISGNLIMQVQISHAKWVYTKWDLTPAKWVYAEWDGFMGNEI